MRTECLTLALVLTATARSVPGREPPVNTPICVLLRTPSTFSGKMVRVGGKVLGSEGGYYLCGACKGVTETGIHIEYPGDRWGSVAPFRLTRDAAFNKLEYYLEAKPVVKYKPPPDVIGPDTSRRYCEVRATMIGRFDAVSAEEALWGRGFGDGRSRFRLVLHRVVRPVAKECPPVAESGHQRRNCLKMPPMPPSLAPLAMPVPAPAPPDQPRRH